MKPSEFYEKYWLVNGKKPRPLTKEEKELMDSEEVPSTIWAKKIIAKWLRGQVGETKEDKK